KIFTALKLIQVHLIINICVFGFAIGMALLGLMIDAILGGVITAQQPPNMLLDIIFVYSATLLQSIMALMMVKGLRDGLYSGSFAPLRGSLVFTIVTGVIIIYSLVMLFLSPAILADMVAQNDMILLLMPNLPMGGLHIGTFASIANILALILYLVLLHQFNNAVKEDATRNL
ncbi:MAG: hypothetical protein FWB98_06350, partial [Defluviitaleaceae bacterium]|nr:hypothetical protein [Defluviitaleaceae bacterium]